MSQSDLVIGPTGPVMPDSAAVLEAVQGDWRAALGDNLNVNPATPQGQLMASQAAAIQDKNAQLLYLASQFNPEQAEGIYQDALAKVYFLERNPARSTVVAIACMGPVSYTHLDGVDRLVVALTLEEVREVAAEYSDQQLPRASVKNAGDAACG